MGCRREEKAVLVSVPVGVTGPRDKDLRDGFKTSKFVSSGASFLVFTFRGAGTTRWLFGWCWWNGNWATLEPLGAFWPLPMWCWLERLLLRRRNWNPFSKEEEGELGGARLPRPTEWRLIFKQEEEEEVADDDKEGPFATELERRGCVWTINDDEGWIDMKKRNATDDWYTNKKIIWKIKGFGFWFLRLQGGENVAFSLCWVKETFGGRCCSSRGWIDVICIKSMCSFTAFRGVLNMVWLGFTRFCFTLKNKRVKTLEPKYCIC